MAAEMLALGIDPLRFIYTKNDLERQILVQLHDKAIKQRDILDQRLAVAIAKEVSKLFG